MKTTLKPFLLILLLLTATLRLGGARPVEYVKICDLYGHSAIPSSGLTLGPSGDMFGTTYGGAAADGTGSIYWLSPNGYGGFGFTTSYSFYTSVSPPKDGQYPYAGLALSPDGLTAYGITQQGGIGGGVGYSFDLSLAEKFPNTGLGYSIWKTFDPATEGSASRGTLVGGVESGYLFGTLSSGGPNGGGSLCSLNLNTHAVGFPHFFSGSGTPRFYQGYSPEGALTIYSGGPSGSALKGPIQPDKAGAKDLSTITLYGITSRGGSNDWGTVYRVDGNGSNFMVLHHFSFSTSDGSLPQGGMVLSGDTLYGTTSGGGASYAGTVFKINTDGSGFQIIGDFDYSTTGGTPQGDLILSGDTLYGTTYGAGINGGGTVFSINTNSGSITVLHSFISPTSNGSGAYTNSDGGWSVSGLLLVGNTLFGTTPYGGTNGVGVAYEIILPTPPSLTIAPAGSNVTVSWPSWASNYVLLQNSSFGATKWSTNSLTVSDNGTNRSVTIAPTAPSTFFRLQGTNAP
jgi:uncharacterized repeat protein (TIGR03803 family)